MSRPKLTTGLGPVLATTVSVLAVAAPAAAQSAAPSAEPSCDAAMTALPGGEITSVVPVPGGSLELTVQGEPTRFDEIPAFCRVSATLRPSAGSNIDVEVWLPAGDAWNGRYVAVGNGGFAGTVNAAAMVDPLRQGYAVSSTDTGHSVTTGEFLTDEEQTIDFAHRAVHEMASASKRIIDAFYSQGPQFSYFSGCSTGGRQAYTAAQRYPEDFDGIVAGAPAAQVTRLQGTQFWEGLLNATMPGGPLTAENLSLIHEAALAQCDALDGVADRVIEDPQACAFDPSSLVDQGLTADQAAIAAAMYQGPRGADGASIFPGLPVGTEAGWEGIMAAPIGIAADTYRYGVHGEDAAWDPTSFEVESEVALAEATIGETFDVVDPDLTGFATRGGKLLIYHGWADPGITAYSTVQYYEAVQATMGEAAGDAVRLFMVPGMGHCRGGEGPSTFDMLTEIDRWVTTGTAPESILAARVRDDVVDRTRPLCPYPRVAVYSGAGSTDEASNFTCEAPSSP